MSYIPPIKSENTYTCFTGYADLFSLGGDHA